MIKRFSVILAFIMIFTCLLAGCGSNDNMTGSVGMDGYELVECDPREDELEVYVDKTKLGVFTLAKSDDGWTLRNANTYLSYSLDTKAVTYDFDPFTWYYDGTGLYCYIQGNNSKLYIQKGGKSIGIAKVSVKFKNWVYEGTDVPKDTVATVTTPDGNKCFKSFSEAWDMVNENKDVPVTIKLYQGLNGSTGMIAPAARSNDAPLVIDLGGHTVDRELYNPTANGSVFRLNKPGNITVKNGTVTGGYTNSIGGGFYIGNVGLNVTLEDLVIKNNEAAEAGGGIYVSENTESLTLNNVTVISNHCTSGNSAGVAWNCGGTKYSLLTVKGNVVISENTANGNASNLVMCGDLTDRDLDAEALSEGSNIGVCYPDFRSAAFTKKLSDAETVLTYFSSDIENYVLGIKDGCLTFGPESSDIKAGLCYNNKWEYFNTFSEAWGRANDEAYSDGDCTVRLFDDWVAENGSLGDGFFFRNGALQPREREEHDSWLVLDLNNHIIDRGLYKVDSNGNVIVDEARNDGMVFYVGSESDHVNFVIKNGTITGGNNLGEGGAIYAFGDRDHLWEINDGPENIRLTNVTVTNNKCTGSGCAVLLRIGNLTIEDSTLENNVATQGYGAGVYFHPDDKHYFLTMSGKVRICNNIGIEGKGDVYLDSESDEVIHGTGLDFANSYIGIAKKIYYKTVSNYNLVEVGLGTDTGRINAFYSTEGNPIKINSQYVMYDLPLA